MMGGLVSVVQLGLLFVSLSLIEVLLSSRSPWWGLAFAVLAGLFAFVSPAFILFPVYLISLQQLYFGVEEWKTLRLTAEARIRRSYIEFRRLCSEEALAQRLRVL